MEDDEWANQSHPSNVKTGDRLQVLWEVEQGDSSLIEEWYDAKICKVKTSGPYPHQIVYTDDRTKEWVNVSSKMCKSASFNERRLRWHRKIFRSTSVKPELASSKELPEAIEKSEGESCAKQPGQSGEEVLPVEEEDFSAPTGIPLQLQLQPEETAKDVRQSLSYVGELILQGKDDDIQTEVPAASLNATPGTTIKRKNQGKAIMATKECVTGKTNASAGKKRRQAGETLSKEATPNKKVKSTTDIPTGVLPVPAISPRKKAARGQNDAQITGNTQTKRTKSDLSDTAGAKNVDEQSESDVNDEDNDEESDEDLFLVEKVTASKKVKGKQVFLVKWLGYPESDNSWEPLENLQGCQYLQDFLSAT